MLSDREERLLGRAAAALSRAWADLSRASAALRRLGRHEDAEDCRSLRRAAAAVLADLPDPEGPPRPGEIPVVADPALARRLAELSASAPFTAF